MLKNNYSKYIIRLFLHVNVTTESFFPAHQTGVSLCYTHAGDLPWQGEMHCVFQK
jgi:hypothetical protein